jgi:PAB1-binding protein PBP1
MKLFLLILFISTILGGFVGAEIADTSFSIIGAVIGGIGTAVVIYSVGGYFDTQNKKSELPPEMHAVFDRMITGKENPTQQEVRLAKKNSLKLAQGNNSRTTDSQNIGFSMEDSMKSIMDQDAELFSRGEIPEKRLIPHHAIKRDIIIAAYTKDFHIAEKATIELSWSQSEKNSRLVEIKKDFDKHIYGIARLSWEELDKIIALMKTTRIDLKEIEADVRSKNSLYKIVEPLCA